MTGSACPPLAAWARRKERAFVHLTQSQHPRGLSWWEGARVAGGLMDGDRREGDLMSRRAILGAAAATAVSTGAAAQQAAPHPKGPLVWLDMDQKELDDAYDQSVYAPNRVQMNKR